MDRLSFLPTIKCSDCGVDIEISQLADHVCATTATNDAPTPASPPSPKLDRAATFGGGASFNNRSDGRTRSGRMPPPARIDSAAANKPFRAADPSPVTNYSDQKSTSPLSPGDNRLPYKMNRSATSPVPRPMGPPSPDFPRNMDSAFPTFPTKRVATPTSAAFKSSDRLGPQRYAEPSPLFAPLSPRLNGGESVIKRMDSIAPGPFDGRGDQDRRPSTSNGPNVIQSGQGFGHRRTATQGSTRSNGNGPNQRTSLASTASRTSTFSNRSGGLPSRPKPGFKNAEPMPPPPPPPKNDESEGIDAFLSRLQKETMAPSRRPPPDNRSMAAPLGQESRDATQVPPPLNTNNNSRRPADSGRPTHRPYPVRTSSRGASLGNIRLNDMPPLPPVPVPSYSKDMPPNPVHTPSDSGLSDDSFASSGYRSAASSRSSPPGSEAGHSRQPSKSGRRDYADEEPVVRTTSPESFTDPRTPPQPQRRTPEPRLAPPPAPAPLFNGARSPNSPMDPAIQRGLSYENMRREMPLRDPALNMASSPLPRGMTAPELRQPERRTPEPRLTEPRPLEPREQVNRRPTAASKGQCRGCSESIVGKSVKDSSGRLTGRYHRDCFVCRTCRSPFPSAEFYVFNNSPYCEHHYHELNGSLCQSCNRGIEGQYLETDRRQKFHPRCLTCSTCRIVLRDDYFEVNGRVFCERHAHHAAAQRNNYLGPGGPRTQNPQKRRTRLMMMM
ncbi:hypothetical protein BS50DRAFT_413919 [Corynespora cassiicola Philippines]|uniref:LIM zinc-binding domain-containing protein n=1 Tax=Corynespora cassiicola Philippines TaxID=1448308 RepID=A0A2T2NLT7_CORCC|nr:hypothetical protein BS50DRAFT_413919 [Corynespora cassiicola Philippines]